jgi:hypothetical protein
MLDRVPELSLLLVDFLSISDLSHLSLANRTLNALLIPKLHRNVKLGIKNPFRDGEEDKLSKKMEKQVASLLSGRTDRLKAARKLTLVGCEWSSKETNLKKLKKVLAKMEVEEIMFVRFRLSFLFSIVNPVLTVLSQLHRAPPFSADFDLRWVPLWITASLQKSSLKSLTIIGSPRRVSSKPNHSAGSVFSAISSNSFMRHLPKGLRSLSISSIELVPGENDEPFPSAVFTTLGSLELVDIDCTLLLTIANSYEVRCSRRISSFSP